MADGDPIRVEVAYARPDVQLIVPLEVATGTTAREAVRRSGLAARFSEIDAQHADIGIWSKPVDGDAVLRDGDRVEIYRPLVADPKEVRRQRAAGQHPDRPSSQGD